MKSKCPAQIPLRGVFKWIWVTAAILLHAETLLAEETGSYQWSITPYLWASDTSVDLRFRDQELGSGEISFKDLLDVLDSSFMVNFEGGKGNWGYLVDLAYLSTSDTDQRTFLTIDTDSEQLMIDAAAVWWPGGSRSGLSILGGVRYSDFDDRYTFSLQGNPLANRRNSRDYYDVLLGVRYFWTLGERWSLLTHADFSFGDSDGSYVLRANFAYAVGKRRANHILFGYQLKGAEFTNGDVKTDYTYQGPMAGFNFRF